MPSDPPPTPRSDRAFYAVNAIFSSAAIALIAFILFRDGGRAGWDLSFMPAVNAFFNGSAALCLCVGWVAVRRGALSTHRTCMVAAFGLSTLFLVGYLAYHYAHGDTRFGGTGSIRTLYLSILASHVVLSITVVPLALTSFYFAYRRAFDRHRRLNRWFLPIWLYVSVTGVAPGRRPPRDGCRTTGGRRRSPGELLGAPCARLGDDLRQRLDVALPRVEVRRPEAEPRLASAPRRREPRAPGGADLRRDPVL
jgi:putative membrane protein